MATSLPRPGQGRNQGPAAQGPAAQGPSSPEHPRSIAVLVAVRRIFGAEAGNYFLLLGATLFLVVFGLVMVLSSSAVESFKATGDAFTGFLSQAVFALLGIPVMLVASRMPTVFWRRWAGTAMLIGVTLQFLVVATPLGIERGGNRNWIGFGSLTFQPSEIVKVALAIWLGLQLAKKIDVLDDWRELLRPVGLVAAVAIGLVALGGDFGTIIILVSIVLGAFFFAGVRLRILAIPVVLLVLGAVVLSMAGGSRQRRIEAWQVGCVTVNDANDLCWQTVHGWWALASGGIFGAGLGNSKAKWSWLPEADNDFIFAVIGEELGLVGAILVLALFILLAISFVRIIRSSSDPFARITVSCVMVWVLGQAFVNIAVVLGLLPVLGVPLPLISAGGSSLVTTLFAIGIALSFARQSDRGAQRPRRNAQGPGMPRQSMQRQGLQQRGVQPRGVRQQGAQR